MMGSQRRNHVALGVVSVVGALTIAFTGSQFDRTIGTVILGLVGLLAWAFVILYVSRSPWRATSAGRSVLYDQLVIAIFSTYVIVANFIPRNSFLNDVRSLLFLVFMVAGLNMLFTLFRSQQEAKQEVQKMIAEMEKRQAEQDLEEQPEEEPDRPAPSVRLEDLD